MIIEDKVYDISTLRHPKGNYILKDAYGNDITRELLGLKAWRFENKAKSYVKFSKHKHSIRTINFLRKYCIGEFALNDLIIEIGHDNR